MKKKTGPKPEDGVGRVRLWGGGPHVRIRTKATLELWHDLYGVPMGRAIDAMLEFAEKHPAFRLKIPKHAKGRKGGPPPQAHTRDV